jgi:hypothetical protein
VKPFLMALCLTLTLGGLVAAPAHADVIVNDDGSDPATEVETKTGSRTDGEEADGKTASEVEAGTKTDSARAGTTRPDEFEKSPGGGICSLARSGSPLAGALYACLGLVALFTARGLARRGR